MPKLYYKDARKNGQREYRNCISHGWYPYLLVLDEFIPAEQTQRAISVGDMQIPVEHIVGTRTAGRSNAFARNFMPLLAEGTEFSGKWEKLCQAHLEEGIRDTIKVYEYMNRFYVEEGNKRVSVLKFFGVDSIMAQVMRVMPERNGAEETEIYYELLDFYRRSKVNFIEFSKKGRYAELQKLLGKSPDGIWEEEERKSFSTAYYYFRKAYEANGGKLLTTTVGDAMLAYMRVYGYQSLKNTGEAEMKKMVTKVWEEITLQQDPKPIAINVEPAGTEQEKKTNLLSKVLGTERKKERVAFLYDKTPETSGWTGGHELGRQYVQRVLGNQVETTPYYRALDGDPEGMIERAIQDGNKIIFTTSPRLLPASLRAAVNHPETTILNCSLNKPHRYIRTYYARIYEAKFIAGALAGSLASNNKVGYICDYPIYGQIAGINAFALGVQLTNPWARVYLEWAARDGVQSAIDHLVAREIRLISSLEFSAEGSMSRRAGLFYHNNGELLNLASPIWQWGVYYEKMLREILNRTSQSQYVESRKALNYYWGMSAGVVDLWCSEELPEGTRKLADLLKGSVRNDMILPFRGLLYGQDGQVHGSDGQTLNLEQIINMDWLLDNVIGSIPSYGELSDEAKETVDQVGVEPSTRDSGSTV